MPYTRLVFLPLLLSAGLASAHSAPITIGIDPTFPPLNIRTVTGNWRDSMWNWVKRFATKLRGNASLYLYPLIH